MKHTIICFLLAVICLISFVSCTDTESGNETTSSDNKSFAEATSSQEEESGTEYDCNTFLPYDGAFAIGHIAISYSPEITKEEASIISKLMPEEYAEKDTEEVFRDKIPDVYIHLKNDSSVCWEFFKLDETVYVKNPDGDFGIADSEAIDTIEKIYNSKFTTE